MEGSSGSVRDMPVTTIEYHHQQANTSKREADRVLCASVREAERHGLSEIRKSNRD